MAQFHRYIYAVVVFVLSVCIPGKEAVFLGKRSLDLSLQGGFGDNATCADLTNHGTHFTVDIDVGTPGQKFSVVADTGSNSLIIPSCVCQQRQYCSKKDRCFTGTNHSSTFSLKQGPAGPRSVFITFGSGTIEAIVAQEKVALGHLDVDMKGGILLMVARKLNIAGKFEGILGLGLPSVSEQSRGKHHREVSKSAKSRRIKDLLKKIMGGIFGGGHRDAVASVDAVTSESVVALPPAGAAGGDEEVLALPLRDLKGHLEAAELSDGFDDIGNIVDTLDSDVTDADIADLVDSLRSQSSPSRARGDTRRVADVAPKGLLEQAGISRFSMCFNDGANGVLKLDTPAMPGALGSVGTFHWGLDFRGISVGNVPMPLSFCSTANMSSGQKTPCGAIPDSGTTVIMAPKEHLSMLFDSICDSWPRCAKNYTAMIKAAEAAKNGAIAQYSWNPFEIAPAAKSTVLQLLLLDCGSWLDESTSLNELPPLKFHVAGAGDKQNTLELPGWAYILESSRDVAAENSRFQGTDDDLLFLQNRTSHLTKVCSPAFGAMEYNTQNNGPVWILGTPFFYEYHVGYDLNSTPPSISFTSTKTTPCVSCGQEAALLSSGGKAQRRPRWISGPLRGPAMDTDLPL